MILRMIENTRRGRLPVIRFRAALQGIRDRGFSFLAAVIIAVGGIAGSPAHAQTLTGLTWTTSTQKLVTAANPQSIAVGDLNGDGIADIAVAQAGSIGVFLGNGDGTFKPADVANDGVTIQAPLSGTMEIAAAAFQSGKPDGIIIVSGAYDATVLGNGTGGEMAPNPISGVASCTSVATGDLTGSGNQDFVVSGLDPNSQFPVVGIYLNSGNGAFRAPTLIPVDSPSPGSVAVGDFVGNGHLDVAVIDGNTVNVFLNDGSGNFSQGVGAAVGNGPVSIAVADFNGDGHQDLAVLNQADGTVSVLLSTGNIGQFNAAPTVKVGNAPSCIVAGDFNRDGKEDLAVTNQTDNTVTVLLGNGDGTFAAPIILPVGKAPTSLAVGNFNGNGNVDLAVVNSGDNTVSILQSQVTVEGGSGTARLINIATRAQVGTGGNILIPGFVIGGTGTETLLIRADGPALTQFGVGGALAQPSLSVFNGAGTLIATNTGWTTSTNPAQITSVASQVGAFAFAAGSADCALIANLPAGAYTAQVSGVNGTTGVALAEVYEVSSGGTSLINIATRAQVGTGGNILIPGFVIGDSGSEELLIRADGPALTQFGVGGALAQPSLSVFNSAGAVIATNTGWGNNTNPTPAQIEGIESSVGAFALTSGSADSVLVVNLQPGAYTIQVSGVNGTTGVALAEVYVVP